MASDNDDDALLALLLELGADFTASPARLRALLLESGRLQHAVSEKRCRKLKALQVTSKFASAAGSLAGAAAANAEKISAEFIALADAMPPSVRAIVVDGVEPSTVPIGSLLAELGVAPRRHLIEERSAIRESLVTCVPAALGPSACATLRAAVDAHAGGTRLDSVDGGPDHQMPLSLTELAGLAGGHNVVRALGELASAHRARSRRNAPIVAHAGDLGEAPVAGPAAVSPPLLPVPPPSDIFVRRYSGSTRPWNPFHQDAAAVTVNIALSDDAAHSGGRLVAVVGDQLECIDRREGALLPRRG